MDQKADEMEKKKKRKYDAGILQFNTQDLSRLEFRLAQTA